MTGGKRIATDLKGDLTVSPPPTLAGIGDCLQEVAAFAALGASATPLPLTESTVRFEQFNRFFRQANGRAVLEARMDSAGRLVIRPGASNYPAPTGSKTVVAGVGPEQAVYTASRHWIDGINRFGQESAEFPFCLVNLPAWRRTPCDLRLAEWYRTEQEALAKYAPPPAPEPTACVATFTGGLQIELRPETRSRWEMWELQYGRRKRKPEFSSPYLDHAKRTAVAWYGEPIGGWRALDGEAQPSRQSPGHAAVAGHHASDAAPKRGRTA